jgi:hypothetical protein
MWSPRWFEIDVFFCCFFLCCIFGIFFGFISSAFYHTTGSWDVSDYSVLFETQELLDALRETICLLCSLLHIVTNFSSLAGYREQVSYETILTVCGVVLSDS